MANVTVLHEARQVAAEWQAYYINRMIRYPCSRTIKRKFYYLESPLETLTAFCTRGTGVPRIGGTWAAQEELDQCKAIFQAALNDVLSYAIGK